MVQRISSQKNIKRDFYVEIDRPHDKFLFFIFIRFYNFKKSVSKKIHLIDKKYLIGNKNIFLFQNISILNFCFLKNNDR